jgi:pimeloyl-ACP methyl ester carboxylesterase
MPVEHRLLVNGNEIALWEWPGEEPAVFLHHATGFHGRCWDQIIAHLPGRHYYAIDARGHGHSSKPAPPYRWRNFGEDVVAIAAQLNLSGAVGVGHSMGGHSVTLAAALRPVAFSSLLLLDPVIRNRNEYVGPWTQAQFVAKRRNRWTSSQEMFERFENRQPFQAWDRSVLRDYCDYGLVPDGDGFVLACPPEIEAGIYENSPVPESNIYPEIESIQIPVHVVRSGKQLDPANFMGSSPTAPDLASNFANATDLVTDHSHFIPMEAPALTAQWIAAL